MSANTHYWTIVFSVHTVLRNANIALNVRADGQRFGEVIQIRGEHSTGGKISNVFNNYEDVVQPLIAGKYTSKRQLEIALRIIKNKLKKEYSDCFSTDYPHMRSILRSVGGVGIDVIKHIVTPGRQEETTKNWETLDSFFEIITFWNNPEPSYIPMPNVQAIIDADTTVTEEQKREIDRLDIPRQLSPAQLDQICETMRVSSSRPAQSAVWKWQSDDGSRFNEFSPEHCKILEKAYQSGETHYEIPDKFWHFDFDHMTQINTKTQSLRGIAREMPSSKGGKRTRKYKYKNRNSSKYRVRLSRRYNN
jgi:hypothetical protein